MTSVNKNNVRNALDRELQRRLLEFAQETLDATGQSFDELDNSVKNQIRDYTRREATKLAQGITDGIDALRQAINTNTSKIEDLESRVSSLGTSTTTTPTP